MGGTTRSGGHLQKLAFSAIVRPFLVMWIGVRVAGRENLPGGPPYIVIANHSSHLDTVMILSMLPLRRLHELRPVAAADYFLRNGLVAWVTRTFFNILPIPRSEISRENNPLELMTCALDEGSALLLFPEGTRLTSDDEQMQHFRSGVAHLVEARPDVPVLPVWVEGARRSLPKGSWIPVPFFCSLRIGETIEVHGGRPEITRQLESAVLGLREP
jgi:1-acyl-sn-glycerol-3-phosphate acyltransferase